MRAIKNPGVVYSGKVGANMGPKRYRTSVARKKAPVMCKNGPMRGETLWLGDATLTTAVFTYRGETGRYIGGHWNAS